MAALFQDCDVNRWTPWEQHKWKLCPWLTGRRQIHFSLEKSLPDTSTGAREPQGRKTTRANESFWGKKGEKLNIKIVHAQAKLALKKSVSSISSGKSELPSKLITNASIMLSHNNFPCKWSRKTGLVLIRYRLVRKKITPNFQTTCLNFMQIAEQTSSFSCLCFLKLSYTYLY